MFLVKSKFDIGETVYYWSVEKVKILFGRIEAISLYQTEDKEPSWRYGIAQIDPKKYKPILSILGSRCPSTLYSERGMMYLIFV